MFFFDYGNAFLLECRRAGAEGTEQYKSYIETILGPQYFDYGFGPYRWCCTSGKKADLLKTD